MRGVETRKQQHALAGNMINIESSQHGNKLFSSRASVMRRPAILLLTGISIDP